MLPLSLLVVSVLFSCLALVVALFSARRQLSLSEYRVQWMRLGDSYEAAATKMDQEYTRIDGDLDRTKDKLEMLETNFRRFRSRVTMQERREAETAEVNSTVPGTGPHSQGSGDRPLTEEEKIAIRQTLHGSRFGIPRNIRED